MVAGPDIARVVTEFEEHGKNNPKTNRDRHHEKTKEVQDTLKKDVTAFVDMFIYMGNPFMEESNNLLTLASKNIADASVIQTVRTVEKLGQDQY